MPTLAKATIRTLEHDPHTFVQNLTDDQIADILQEANFQYFNKGKPLFDDAIYDFIREFLQERNPNHPILKGIGASVMEKKVKLPYYMGSMDKFKTDAEIQRWVSKHPNGYMISDKLDGNSALLVCFPNGSKLYTRGDGTEGQDITHLLPFLNLHMDKIDTSQPFAVRGELIMKKSDFAKVANQGKNARNMVAGLLNAKKTKLALARLVQFVVYEVIKPEGLAPGDQLDLARKLGLQTVHHKSTSHISGNSLAETLASNKAKSMYEIDGIVVYHNRYHERVVGKNPKHAFAFKSTTLMEKANVTVTGIEWNISKDGYIKPVVLFDPVVLTGVNIKRATGHNAKFVNDNMIGPGATITITRSGDVIPFISDVITPAPRPSLPTDINYTWNKTGVDIVVSNASSDEHLRFKILEFFFNKVDVKGLSSGTLKKLYDAGYTTPRDIVNISMDQVLAIDGFQEKSASNITHQIRERFKDVDTLRLMAASNSFGRAIGEKTLALVAKNFPGFLEGRCPPVHDLVKVKGIEEKTAAKIHTGMHQWLQFQRDNQLKSTTKPQAPPKRTNPQVVGKTYVFTGFRDKDLEQYIADNGGEVKGTVTKNTNYLVYKGDQESSKASKARDLGVTTIDISDFRQHFGI
jgi:DNA ligase (NAD+)